MTFADLSCAAAADRLPVYDVEKNIGGRRLIMLEPALGVHACVQPWRPPVSAGKSPLHTSK